ncbi:MAG: sigma-70 family RNA polymerase sigma factor [Bacteroidales bacterium]|nr:sigma-70 family RNA polymerase sigma factor [Bacteroidales bacterium]
MTAHLTAKGKRDYDLVRRALEYGDQKAYANLLELYREPIYYMILQMIKNDAEADDLTIEAFGKAFKNLESYTPTYAFSTWLFTIATNNCIDYIRRKKMNMISLDADCILVNGEQIHFNFVSDSLDPEETIIAKQKIKLMRQVIETLKPVYKQLIEMYYFQELSCEEIGQILSMTPNLVKVKLFRARELLYNIVKQQLGDI